MYMCIYIHSLSSKWSALYCLCTTHSLSILYPTSLLAPISKFWLLILRLVSSFSVPSVLTALGSPWLLFVPSSPPASIDYRVLSPRTCQPSELSSPLPPALPPLPAIRLVGSKCAITFGSMMPLAETHFIHILLRAPQEEQ